MRRPSRCFVPSGTREKNLIDDENKSIVETSKQHNTTQHNADLHIHQKRRGGYLSAHNVQPDRRRDPRLARAIHDDDGPKTDECATALRALAALGVPCGIFYSPTAGGRHEITDEIIQRFSLRANERTLQAGIVDPESLAE